MNLAIILFLSIFCVSWLFSERAPHSALPAQTQSAAQQQTPAATSTQDQTKSQTSPSPASSTHNQPAAQHPHRKKKTPTADCNPVTNSRTKSNNSGTGQSNTSKANPTAGKRNPPANCPPQKVIVKQGGSSEPAIELVGTPAVQDSETAKKLQTTEANLKKIESATLNSSQQDIIKQIRQFIQESRTATAAGDLNRASTLATKAQLLSEELLNPQP
jgi:hypothetical protein